MGNVEVTYCRHASIVLKYLNLYIYCRQLLFPFLLLLLVLDQQSLKVGTQSVIDMEFTCVHTHSCQIAAILSYSASGEPSRRGPWERG